MSRIEELQATVQSLEAKGIMSTADVLVYQEALYRIGVLKSLRAMSQIRPKTGEECLRNWETLMVFLQEVIGERKLSYGPAECATERQQMRQLMEECATFARNMAERAADTELLAAYAASVKQTIRAFLIVFRMLRDKYIKIN